jgi:hypothetical protein
VNEAALGCYRAAVSTNDPVRLAWTQEGGDQDYRQHPRRSGSMIVTAKTRGEAAAKARELGSAMFGGRTVSVDRVEEKCPPGTHARGVA